MKIFSSIILLFLCSISFAQELVPLQFDKSRKTKYSKFYNQKGTNILDTIQLPFFDDFSITELSPDSSRFLNGEGTFINNTFCINPPTFNVATFDGLDDHGSPYNEINQYDRGLCDALTSQAINLNGSSNSVFMSFFWQAQGHAALQVPADSIQLSFLDTANNWNVVWTKNGQSLNDFKLEMIEVTTGYIHNGFQFKFENFGNRTGMFGVWHIDYIYIDDNRSLIDSVFSDMAFSNTPSSYLEKYWAMPVWQFFDNPTKEISTSTTTTFNNLRSNGPRIPYITDTHGAEININNGDSLTIEQTMNLSVPVLAKQVELTGLNTNFLTPTNDHITIKNKFTLDFEDQDIGDEVYHINGNNILDENGDTVFAKHSTKQNDTISSYTLLTDYYAYDDGSAEQAFRIKTDGSIVVQEFELNRADTLYGMAFYFPGNPYQYDSTQMVLMVWSEASGSYDATKILYDERVLISVADSLNGFTYYNFLEPVILPSGNFYIGYKQDNADDILIGFDINNSPLEPIYFNSTGTWQQYRGPGVLMLRPLMEAHQFTSIAKDINIKKIKIYPNPAQNELYFSENITHISLLDITGKQIYQESGEINRIDLSQFENGIYFLNLWNSEKNVQYEKLIIAK